MGGQIKLGGGSRKEGSVEREQHKTEMISKFLKLVGIECKAPFGRRHT